MKAKSKILREVEREKKEKSQRNEVLVFIQQIFCLARRTALRISDLFQRSQQLASIGETTKSNDDFEKAYEIAKEIPDDFLRNKAFISIIEGLIRLGNLKKSIELAEEIQDPLYRDKGFKIVIKGLIEKDDLKRAKELVREVEDNIIRAESLILIGRKSKNIRDIEAVSYTHLTLPTN